MIPFWIFIAIAAGLSSSLFNFLSRNYLRDGKDATAYGWLLELIRTSVYFLLLPLGFFIIISPYSLLIFLLLGLSEIGSIYAIMKMHEYSHLSISTIISRTRLIWVALISFLFFGEQLNLQQYSAIALLFIGLLIVTTPRQLRRDKGVKYAHLAAFFSALVAIFLKASSLYTTPQMSLVIMGIFPLLFLPLLMKDATRRLKRLRKSLSFSSIIPITAYVLGGYLYTLALSLGEASIIVALYQGSMIFSVLGGIILLKEHGDIRKKLIGSMLALGAIILLALV